MNRFILSGSKDIVLVRFSDMENIYKIEKLSDRENIYKIERNSNIEKVSNLEKTSYLEKNSGHLRTVLLIRVIWDKLRQV